MRIIKIILLSLSLVLVLEGCEDDLTKDISSIPPKAELTADELIDGLQNDGDFFREEILSVEGALVEVNSKNGTINVLLKGNDNQKNYIICEMNPSIDLGKTNLSEGQTLTVKGILKGYLNDAVLLNCVLDNSDRE